MWILLTFLATCLQIARTSEQHRLRIILNPSEAAYIRFVYAFPIALLLGSAWVVGPGELPAPPGIFWIATGVASISQILGTVFLLRSFRPHNFAVGTLYAKTEILFVGIASTVLLGETLTPLAWLGGLLCLAGIALLITNREKRVTMRLNKAALLGLLAGASFALASVALRAASLSLTGKSFDRAVLTLVIVLGMQTLIQGVPIGFSSQASLKKIAQTWRQACIVAVLSLGGSMAWIVAMTLENAAKVRTLGQTEILLAFAVGIVVHHEKHQLKEYLAVSVALLGIVVFIIA